MMKNEKRSMKSTMLESVFANSNILARLTGPRSGSTRLARPKASGSTSRSCKPQLDRQSFTHRASQEHFSRKLPGAHTGDRSRPSRRPMDECVGGSHYRTPSPTIVNTPVEMNRTHTTTASATHSPTDSAKTPLLSTSGVNTAPIAHASTSTSSRPLVPGSCARQITPNDREQRQYEATLASTRRQITKPGSQRSINPARVFVVPLWTALGAPTYPHRPPQHCLELSLPISSCMKRGMFNS